MKHALPLLLLCTAAHAVELVCERPDVFSDVFQVVFRLNSPRIRHTIDVVSALVRRMNAASAQFFAIALTAMWCGFGFYGILRKIERSPQARELLDRFRRARVSTKGAVVAGLVAVVAIGGTKPGGGDPPRGFPSPAAGVVDPAVAPVEVRTNNVALRTGSSSAVEVEDWRRHGSFSGGVWLENGCCIAATPVGIAAGKNEMARHHSSVRHHLEETSLHA